MSKEFRDVKCEYCGKIFDRYVHQIKKRNFCNRKCLGAFNSKTKNPGGYEYRDFSKNSERFTEMNKELNPTRMRDETREKLREAHVGKGAGKTYPKVYGRHEHRIVAEQMLGRPLKPGEVVHHIDGDKRNNHPDNLMIFPNQGDHAAHHAALNRSKGGDSIEV